MLKDGCAGPAMRTVVLWINHLLRRREVIAKVDVQSETAWVYDDKPVVGAHKSSRQQGTPRYRGCITRRKRLDGRMCYALKYRSTSMIEKNIKETR